MLKRIKNKCSIIFCLLIGCFLFGVTVNAESGFSVNPIFNASQIDPNASLFYVKTVPGQEQTLEVEIVSAQKEPVEIEVSVKDAYTNSAGRIGYDIPSKIASIDETLTNPISELVKPEAETITVENFETKKMTIKVTPPDKEYPGVKMGSISFITKEKSDKALQNDMSFEVGIILASNGEAFDDGEELNFNHVRAELIRGQKMVLVNLQNPSPKTLENLVIESKITEKETKKVIKTKKVEGAAMAPNSNFDYEMEWGLAELPSGKFIYDITVSNESETWDFTKEFEIKKSDAKKINDESAFNIEVPSWIKIIVIVQGCLLVVVTMCIIMRRKNLKKELAKKRNRKNNKKKNKRKG